MRNTKKKKENNKITIIIIILLLIIGSGYYITTKSNQAKDKLNENKLTEIKKHYGSYVKTTKETNILDKENNTIGKINADVELSLEDIEINKDTKYFKIKDLIDGYIAYQDVSVIDSINLSDRYKKYIPFNKNIKTNDTVTFYDENDNYLYKLNNSYDLVVYIKDDNKYGVEFNNKLLYVHKEDVASEYDNHNTDLGNATGVGVLNYHFFYDQDNKEDSDTCREVICHSKKQFKEQLDTFKELDLFTVTMKELELYMDGKLKLPKSVLITIDDGGRTNIAVDMLTEYKMNATIFLITSWFDPKTYYKTDYIELHSHTNNMHDGGKCPGGQGAAIKCLPEEQILADLKASREALGGSTAFCYPFYEYNDYSTKLVSKAGFTMAFIGEIPTSYGYKLAEVNGDKLKIPRFVIMTHTTIKDLKEYFNEIKIK